MLDDTITITVRGWWEVDSQLSNFEADASNNQEMKIIRREIISALKLGRHRFEVTVRYTFECASDAVAVKVLVLE